jgi:hypothetical protein
MRIVIYLLAMLIPLSVLAQSKVTVSGTISSGTSGEFVIGAVIHASSTSQGTVSNEYGFYSLTLKQGEYKLLIESTGFMSDSIMLDLVHDTVVNIRLNERSNELEEVIISTKSSARALDDPQMGMEKLSVSDIKNVPVLLGEKDIIKVAQLLPGIKSAGDGSSGFYVRGGAPDQNLIQIDEATVYNASHLLGFFSTFNSDAIKDVTIYKSGMPAQYGGRLSSVMDVRMNEGNNQDFNISGGLGLISSRLCIEGPIEKDRSSFLISARRTYADMFLKLSNDPSLNNNKLYFYDLNAKLNYKLDEKDRLYISGYFGRDKLGFAETFGLDWGNGTGTIRWNHIFSSKLFSNTSVIYSNYNYKISIENGGNKFDIFSQIENVSLKQELQYYPNDKNTVRFGYQSIYHDIRPGEVTSPDESSVNSSSFQNRYGWENALYATNTWKMTSKLSVTYGCRLTSFSILGSGDYYEIDKDGRITDTIAYAPGDIVKTFVNPEPRLALSFKLPSQSSVKASYVRNVQNLHLVSNSTSSNPTDKWVATTNNIKPEISDQFSLGYYKDIDKGKFEFTLEAYYKNMSNQIDYKDGADILSNAIPIDAQLLFGKGRAYGIEFLAKKKSGKLSGWIGYTLSKTERKIEGINGDDWYNARQDRTHDISIVAMYDLNKKWTFSANWVYYTGDAITFPVGKYRVDGKTIFYYTERNGYRMPDYHRLDIGATWTIKRNAKSTHDLTFSVYNTYGRENAYVIDFRDSETNPEQTEVVQTALFKYIPSITYNFKF